MKKFFRSILIITVVLLFLTSCTKQYNSEPIYNDYINAEAYFNNEISYSNLTTYGDFDDSFKWCGAVAGNNGHIYAIPNSSNQILDINTVDNSYTLWGDVSNEELKWTGGGYYNGYIYAFPRSSNSLLKIDYKNKSTEEIELPIDYSKQHHYSGVIYGNTAYVSPRDSDNILKINLDTYECDELKISLLGKKYYYYGAVIGENGMIYFLPYNNEKIMALNANNDDISFFGSKMDCHIVSALYCENKNIYGFCATGGILKIDTVNKTSEILYEDTVEGCYSAEFGANGLIYSSPSASGNVYEFDPITEKYNIVDKLDVSADVVSFAGSAVSQQGSIYFTPAQGNKFAVLQFSESVNITNDDIVKYRVNNNY